MPIQAKDFQILITGRNENEGTLCDGCDVFAGDVVDTSREEGLLLIGNKKAFQVGSQGAAEWAKQFPKLVKAAEARATAETAKK